MVIRTAQSSASASYHHGDLRPALIDAARALLEETGDEAISLRAVARRAGVSRAAPYHHFRDKTALLAAVAAQGVLELNAELGKAASMAGAPEERLHALGVAYVVAAVRNPALFLLSQGREFADAEAHGELAEARRSTFRLLYEAVGDCMPDAGDERRREAFGAAWSLVHGMAVLAIDRRLEAILPQQDIAELASRLVTFIRPGQDADAPHERDSHGRGRS